MNEVTTRGTEATEVYEGDQITVGITHQIEVGRDKAWVKYEAITKIRPQETSDQARTRAIRHVNASVMETIEATVEQMRSKT